MTNTSDPMVSFATSFTLEDIRRQLEELENDILLAFSKRARFFLNAPVYAPCTKASKACLHPNMLGNILNDIELLREKHQHSVDPEALFFSAPSILDFAHSPVLKSSSFLLPNNINLNSKIFSVYTENICPLLAPRGDDPTQYFDTALADIVILQLLSKRIHLGKYVAAFKFQLEQEKYTSLIKQKNDKGILDALQDSKVELGILDRVVTKTENLNRLRAKLEVLNGHEISCNSNINPSKGHDQPLDSENVRLIFQEYIIPLTKQVELDYFYLCA